MGWYSINIGLAHRDTQIHCFESIPHTCDFLREKLRMNAVPNVTAHNFGFLILLAILISTIKEKVRVTHHPPI